MPTHSMSASFHSIPSFKSRPAHHSSLVSIRFSATRDTVVSIASGFSGTTEELLESAAYFPEDMPQGEGPDVAQAQDLYYRRLFHVAQAQRILEGKGRRKMEMGEEERERLYEVLSFLYPPEKTSDGSMDIVPGMAATMSPSVTHTTTAMPEATSASGRTSSGAGYSLQLYNYAGPRWRHDEVEAERKQKQGNLFDVQRGAYVDQGRSRQISLGEMSDSSSGSMGTAITPSLPPKQTQSVSSIIALPPGYYAMDLEKGEAGVKPQGRSYTSLALFIFGFLCPWLWAINGWIWEEEKGSSKDEDKHRPSPRNQPLFHCSSISNSDTLFQIPTYPTTRETTPWPGWLTPPLTTKRSSIQPVLPVALLTASSSFLHHGDRWIYASRWAALISTPLCLVSGTTILVLSLGYRAF